jgi:hypothetical protein
MLALKSVGTHFRHELNICRPEGVQAMIEPTAGHAAGVSEAVLLPFQVSVLGALQDWQRHLPERAMPFS